MRQLPKVAWLLGYGGIVPFALLTLMLLVPVEIAGIPYESVVTLLVSYAAVILSFLGAVHWGVALTLESETDRCRQVLLFSYSVTPALAAWLILLLPGSIALLAMAAMIVIAWIVDRSLLFGLLNSSYATLRLHLTVIVASLLLIAGVFG